MPPTADPRLGAGARGGDASLGTVGGVGSGGGESEPKLLEHRPPIWRANESSGDMGVVGSRSALF